MKEEAGTKQREMGKHKLFKEWQVSLAASTKGS